MLPLSEEELDSMVDRERSRNLSPLNDWGAIAARLREQGLIRDRGEHRSVLQSPWMKIAAAVLIAVGGGVVGRYTAAPKAAQISNATSAGATQTSADAATDFHSIDEAWAVLNRAGAQYQKASAYLAANNSVQSVRADSAPLYQARLAALEQVMRATHSALDQAPNDPVINQYYLATMGAREATRQQLNAAQTVGLKLKGF